MTGWIGKILEIDLSTQTTKDIVLDKEVYKQYIGGKGLSGYFIAQKAAYNWDDPPMPVCLFTGPLVGTRAPTSGRMTIASRSPLTGGVGDTSVGGRLGSRIKKAGYDGLLVVGKSDSWIGIEISDHQVLFKSADTLLDLSLSEISNRIVKKGTSIAAIGKAAQNGVLFSSVMVDNHYAAARGGIGLNFASKKLKYITVAGTGNIPVCDPDELKIAREDVFRMAAASSILLGEHGLSNLGTPALFDLMHARRMMPTANFRRTWFEPAPGLNANALRKKYKTKKFGCNGCHILCKKRSADGQSIPEFETLSHFTALIENQQLDLTVAANELCNEYGMDTITAASTIACYAEIEDKPLTADRVMDLLALMGQGKGIGELLKLGSARYAAAMGKPQLSMSVKSMELPAYDPRGAYGMALAYATSTRGGCHLRAYPIGHEILRKPVATDRFSFGAKARIIKIAEDKNALIDSLTACKFVFFASSFEEYARAFSAITGVQMTATDLSLTGERIYYNDRLMNDKWGFDAAQDDLPQRFFTESGTAGPGFVVPAINRADFLEARRKYYRVRGLDENGKPTRQMAEKLGLPWIN